MKHPSTLRTFTPQTLAYLLIMSWLAASGYAGETCLNTPGPDDWRMSGGPIPLEVTWISQAPNDPTCLIDVPLDQVASQSDCSGWIGKPIDADSVEVEHQLFLDPRELSIPVGGEIVLFDASRTGQPTATIRVEMVKLNQRQPQLRVTWQSDVLTGSEVTDLAMHQGHLLDIRWRGSATAGGGLIEVTMDNQDLLVQPGLTLDATRPDLFRIGVISCTPSVSGRLRFAPLSTTLFHF